MSTTPVPWITMWSAEQDGFAQHCMESSLGWSPRGLTGNLFRAYGFAWKEFPNLQGVGRPLWAEVHTQRQFQAMRGPRCQVCGTRFPKGEPIPWLVTGEVELESRDRVAVPNGAILLGAPPTCLKCMPVAEKKCPHLAAKPEQQRLMVYDFKPVAVTGDYWPSADPESKVPGVYFFHEKRYTPFVLAKQLMVALTEFDPLKGVESHAP